MNGRLIRALWLAGVVHSAVMPEALAADPAQRVVRIGFLAQYAPVVPATGAGLIGQELAKLGYVEGKNLIVEVRHGGGSLERLPDAAADLVKLKVDVIFAVTSPAAFVAQRATNAIPIVGWALHGAVETGLAASLHRPGGNLTGTESLAPELDVKRIELLKRIVPGLAHLAVVYDGGDQGSPAHLNSLQNAGKTLGISLSALDVRRAEDLGSVLDGAAGRPLGGVLTLTSSLTFRQFNRISAFALAHKLPTLCEFRELARAGCLLSYGTSLNELTQRSAALIDKIIRGSPPNNLPLEQMTRFELAVNLRTAKSIGVAMPNELILRADEVIE
jgi:putative tryptophan/tyrosine transport system substrate-binding protein